MQTSSHDGLRDEDGVERRAAEELVADDEHVEAVLAEDVVDAEAADLWREKAEGRLVLDGRDGVGGGWRGASMLRLCCPCSRWLLCGACLRSID